MIVYGLAPADADQVQEIVRPDTVKIGRRTFIVVKPQMPWGWNENHISPLLDTLTEVGLLGSTEAAPWTPAKRDVMSKTRFADASQHCKPAGIGSP